MDANVAWKQISINTKMACGARKAVGSEDSLRFNVLRGNKTKIFITLNGKDLYDIELGHIRRDGTWQIDEEQPDVYDTELSEVIYHMCNK